MPYAVFALSITKILAKHNYRHLIGTKIYQMITNIWFSKTFCELYTICFCTHSSIFSHLNNVKSIIHNTFFWRRTQNSRIWETLNLSIIKIQKCAKKNYKYTNIISQVLYIMCHLSCLMCHVSRATCNLSHVTIAKIHSHRPSPC